MEARKHNWLGVVFSAVLLSGAGLLLAGCADDLYASCELDSRSQDPAVQQCGANEPGESKSCVVENQTQCDTRVCGRFNGSTPFCTQRCSSDGDCPAGLCVEFVFQSGAKYCVEEANIRE